MNLAHFTSFPCPKGIPFQDLPTGSHLKTTFFGARWELGPMTPNGLISSHEESTVYRIPVKTVKLQWF